MKHVILLSCLILTLSFAKAQKEESRYHKWAGTFTGALIPLPEVNIGIQPGIQYRISKKLLLLNEFTFRVGRKNAPDSSAFDKQYFRIQPEFRYFLNSKKRSIEPYLGIRLSYAFRKYFNIKGGHYLDKSSDDSATYYNSAIINSPVKTASLQFGLIFFVNRKFSADVFLGGGVRFIHSTFSEIKKPVRDRVGRPRDGLHFTSPFNCNYPVTLFQINAGARIIYHFDY